MDVDYGLSIMCQKLPGDSNTQKSFRTSEVPCSLYEFQESHFFFFSPRDIFINAYPCFISVPPVDVFRLNIASLNKKNIMNCY